MKTIEIEDDLYQYILSNTQYIGESASSILKRLLALSPQDIAAAQLVQEKSDISQPEEKEALVQDKTVSSAPVSEGESVFNYINKQELAHQRGAVGRFLLILAALYRVHQSQFSVVNDIRGRDRLYFATSEEELAESGSSTKPRQIPDSPFWVITNSNTTRKKMMLTEVAIALGYNVQQAEEIRELL
ncbi:replication initiation negative regulator SeqA [Thalassotalea sp. LPB0316]|uniref:replication initiation negative regulator SeqA n=1 Tax=Thalassotalea sp. LPB0316 TaxID=2769490 RepID=UPI001867C963|nr:replication initiation negative regulator SeqA [Thalassotalea sp. LPB0316]QOL24353.1 replication initiation negative regulator SeqA [Thalassotalea sp. LPB0316]